jgi:MGT family glycosyltransferase
MGKHVAFFNIPAIGHVYPTLAVVAELVRRGHRVTYATIDKRAALLEAAGAEVVPYRSSRPGDSDPDMRAPRRGEYISQSLLCFLEEAEATLPQLEPRYAGDPPDLIVHDRMSFAGRVYAAKHNLPTIQLWPMLVSNENWSMSQTPGGFDPTHPSYVAYLAKLNAFLASHGLSLTPDEFLTPAPARHLAFFPRAFQYQGELYDDRYRFVGPCIRARSGTPAWRPAASDRPVLLVSMGTVYNRLPAFYRMCLRAFAGSRWQVVVAVGERMQPRALGPVPDNAEVHQFVPQLDVLAHATVFLSHAGMGGAMEALSEGVPQVTLPQTLEQEANAERLAQLGLGVRLPATRLTPAALRETVERVAADGAVASRLRAMRAELRAAGGTPTAADVIEDCLTPSLT